jgi:hypothetical protein
MAIRKVTSFPRPSTRNSGWHFVYYNERTERGGECVALLSPAVKDLVKPGFTFDDSCLDYSEDLQSTVLQLDFDEPAGEDELPPEDGWGDPDPMLHSAPSGAPVARGVRPQTLRKREAAAQADRGSRMPAELMKISLEINACFQLHYSLLSNLNDTTRAQTAQKLVATSAIPYYRAAGVELDKGDVQAMTSY